MKHRLLWAGAVLLLGTRCASSPITSAIVGADVITMRSDAVLRAQTILIAGDRIVAIGASSALAVPRSASVIDARDLFVMPGLSDMHVHMTKNDIPLFLANGVTTVREMNGTPAHLVLRDAIERGETIGPRMIVAGPLLAGVKQRWRHRLVTTPADGTAEVEAEIGAGYDEIKVYDGLSAATYAAIAVAAKKGGKPLVGHVPHDVGLSNAIAAGQATIEHTETILHAANDPSDTGKLVALFVSSGAWFTPTLGVETVLSTLGSEETNALFDSVRMDLVDEDTRAWWNALRARKSGERGAEFLRFKREFVRAAKAAGVPMLFGTDAPNPLIVPGFGIHVESKALADAGLLPYQILQMLTTAPARFLHSEGGVVVVGAPADLVLLGANPLENVDNLRHVRGVMLRGRYIADPGRPYAKAPLGLSRGGAS